jgi:hypothetical protein
MLVILLTTVCTLLAVPALVVLAEVLAARGASHCGAARRQ